MSKAETEVISVRPDEILLFDVLPENYTSGTSYDYYRQFPGLNEEIYYLLECATRQNADPDAIVKACKEVVEERNKQLIEKFNNTRSDPYEMEMDLEDISYGKV